MNEAPLFQQTLLAAFGTTRVVVLAIVLSLTIAGWWFTIRYRALLPKKLILKTLGFFLLALFIPFANVYLALFYLLGLLLVILVGGLVLLTGWWQTKTAQELLGPREGILAFVRAAAFVLLLFLTISAGERSLNLAVPVVSGPQLATEKVEGISVDVEGQRVYLTFWIQRDMLRLWLPVEYETSFQEDFCYAISFYRSPLFRSTGRVGGFLMDEHGYRSDLYITGIAQSNGCK